MQTDKNKQIRGEMMARFTGAGRRAGFWRNALLLLASAMPLFAQPVINGITPNFLLVNQAVDQEITVTGSGFVAGAVVVFGTTDLTTTVGSATSLTAKIPVNLLILPGSVNVTVRNPPPGNETSLPVVFTIVGVPTVAAISPDTAVAGSPGFSLTVTGTNFTSASSVLFDGGATLTPTAQTETQLTVEIPASKIATAGPKSVIVRNPVVPDSNALNFTVTPAPLPAPTITLLNPATAVAGSAALQIAVTGTGFVDGTVVVFGGANLATSFGSATQLTATIPAPSLVTPGAVQVSVRNPDAQVSGDVTFTITGVTPTLTSISPASVVAGASDTTLTLTGSDFQSGAVVLFGATELTPVNPTSTQLTVTVPASLLNTARTVDVRVRNPGDQHSQPKSFTVVAALSVTYPSTIVGERATAITAVNPSVSGGLAPYGYSIAVGGTLPAGLAIDPATGVVSGTPTQAATATVKVKVVDSGTLQQTATSQDIVITIHHPPLQVVTLSPLPTANAGDVYPITTLAASGGDGGPYTWSLKSGTLPSGLTLSADGVITGTPLAAGVVSVEVQVSDGANTTPATSVLTLTIVPVITVLNPSNRPAGNTDLILRIEGLGFVGNKTSVTFGATVIPQESVAVTGSAVTTALLTIPGSALATAGPVPVTVTVNGATSSASTFTVIGDTTITITNESNLGTRTTGTPFSVDLEATGGNGNYTWSVAIGSTLPGGLNLNAGTGVISGTLSEAGSFSFTIRVVDNANPGQSSGQKTFNLLVQDFVVGTTSLPQARVGIAYSAPLAVAGGPTAPPSDYQWTLISGNGSLPGGIAFNPATGIFSGTPEPIGAPSQNFTVQVSAKHTPSGLVTPARTLQLTVSGGGLDISAASLPFGVVGQPYGPTGTGVTISAVNGTAPYRFEVDGAQENQLSKAGFRIDTLNNDASQKWNVRISGTPTQTGSFPLTVTLRDAGNTQVARTLTILVLANALSIQPETLPPAIVNVDYTQQLSLTGASAEETSVTWALLGNSHGLRLDPSTGKLTGKFGTVGSFAFTVQASTSLRETTRVYTLAVGGPHPVISTTSLPPAQVGQNYDQPVTATGGTPGYTWQLSSGILPQGLNFDTVSTPGAARIVGTPSSGAQSQTFTLTVRDSLGQTDSREFTLAVTSTPIPAVTLESFTNPAPAEQKDVVVRLAQAYPVELKGTATLTFTPNVPNNVDDPKVVFLSGGRTANFTIPANTTQAVFDSVPVQRVQTGTVAGTARVQVAITGGGPTASQEFTIARSAPFLQDSLTLQTTGSGFNVVITGYSTPRDLTSARVTFTPTAGTNLQTTELTVPLTASATTWFDSPPGKANGSAFKLTIPFTVQNGSNAVASVTVVLTNSVGASNSRTRTF